MRYADLFLIDGFILFVLPWLVRLGSDVLYSYATFVMYELGEHNKTENVIEAAADYIMFIVFAVIFMSCCFCAAMFPPEEEVK